MPGHPIAGTEQSGPEAGFAELFENRWCILTPPADADACAIARLREFWEACGSTVEEMDPDHHDLVLAIVSHLPHIIAYNIVGNSRRSGSRDQVRSDQVLGLRVSVISPGWQHPIR
jgi:cyclohexadieny/prephenate dehydrogenase